MPRAPPKENEFSGSSFQYEVLRRSPEKQLSTGKLAHLGDVLPDTTVVCCSLNAMRGCSLRPATSGKVGRDVDL